MAVQPGKKVAAQTPQRRPGPAYFPGLDGARLLCALLVMVYHYCYWVRMEPPGPIGLPAASLGSVGYPALTAFTWFGHIGVDVFFVISGFVISQTVLNRSTWDFAINRFTRIFPPVWFFSTLALGVTFLYSSASWIEILRLWMKSLVLFPVGPWIDGVYWSLCIELFFYVLAALAVRRWGERGLRMLMWALGWTSSLAVVVACLASWLGLQPLVKLLLSYPMRQLLVSPGAAFALGMGLFLLLARKSEHAVTAALPAFALAAAVWVFLRSHGPAGAVSERLVAAAAFLVLVAVLVVSLCQSDRLLAMPKVLAALKAAGAATYPSYLLHNISGSFLLGTLLLWGVPSGWALVATVLTVLLCAGCFGLVLDPLIRRSVLRAIEGGRTGYRQARAT